MARWIPPTGIVQHASIASMIFAILMSLTSCEQLAEGLAKAVVVEYDHAMNFDSFTFSKAFFVEQDQSSWSGIELSDEDSDGVLERGVFALFLICSIRNEGSEAETFTYDINKFHVLFNDKPHYYGPLVPYTFANGIPANAPEVSAHFHTETQLGPNQTTIPPGTDDAFSIAWRLAVFVPTIGTGGQDLGELDFELLYDGTPVLLDRRGQDPENAVNGSVDNDGLPNTCRPPVGT